MWISGFPSTIFWEDLPFPIVYSWFPCQRSVDHICMGLFLGFLFCSISLYVCFYVLSSTVYFEIRKCDASSLVLLALSCFYYLGSFVVPYNQSILKEISPGCSLEGLMLKLKLQYFGHLMRRVDSLEKTDAGRDWGQEEKRMTEDEMAGWHHWLDGHEFGWTPGVGDGQGGLACCGSWGCKESDINEWLN